MRCIICGSEMQENSGRYSCPVCKIEYAPKLGWKISENIYIDPPSIKIMLDEDSVIKIISILTGGLRSQDSTGDP